jgi:hypothetical protein
MMMFAHSQFPKMKNFGASWWPAQQVWCKDGCSWVPASFSDMGKIHKGEKCKGCSSFRELDELYFA